MNASLLGGANGAPQAGAGGAQPNKLLALGGAGGPYGAAPHMPVMNRPAMAPGQAPQMPMPGAHGSQPNPLMGLHPQMPQGGAMGGATGANAMPLGGGSPPGAGGAFQAGLVAPHLQTIQPANGAPPPQPAQPPPPPDSQMQPAISQIGTTAQSMHRSMPLLTGPGPQKTGMAGVQPPPNFSNYAQQQQAQPANGAAADQFNTFNRMT